MMKCKVEKFEVEKKYFQVKFEGSNGGTWVSVTERSRVQDYYDQVGGDSKETFGDTQMSKSIFRGGRSYAEVVVEDGLRIGVPLSVGKWARAVISNAKKKSKTGLMKASKESRMVPRAGKTYSERKIVLLRRWSPRENMIIPGKFRRGNEGSKEAVKLLDLTKVKLWVEMHPNVVLPELLEVEDGAWKYTVVVAVIGEEDEDNKVTSETTHCRNEWMEEGVVSLSRQNLQRGYEVASGAMNAIVGSFFPGHVIGVQVQVWQPKGRMDGKGVAWPSRRIHAPQAHEIAATSPPSLLRVGSSAKATTQPCPGDERADVKVIYGEVSLERKKVQRERESSSGSEERLHAGGKDDSFKEDVVQPLPASADRRQGQRSSSEPLPLWSASPFNKVRNLEVDCGTGSQKVQGIRESPIFRCLLSRKFTGSPSIPRIRGKGIILEGNCEILGAENMEKSQPFSSQPPEPSSFPFCNLKKLLPSPSGPHLLQSAFLSQSHTFGDTVASPLGDFLIDGLSPRKMAKVREVLCSLDIKVWNTRGLGSSNKRRLIKDFLRSENLDVVMILETKNEKCDRRFVGSVWTVGNKIGWFSRRAGLQADFVHLGLKKAVQGGGGIRIFLDLCQVVLDSCGPLWISAVYGPNSPSLRKDFWVELYDIYGLTFPLCSFPKAFKKPLLEGPRIIGQLLWIPNPFMWGPTPFRFENMWLQHPSFKENFRNWKRGFQGNGWEGHKFMRRLQSVKAKLKEWNKFSFGELNEKKKSILNDLDNFDAIEQEGGLISELIERERVRVRVSWGRKQRRESRAENRGRRKGNRVVVESKLFEVETEERNGKRHVVISKSKGELVSWVRLGPASVGLVLEGLSQCLRNGEEGRWEKGWKEKGRLYSMRGKEKGGWLAMKEALRREGCWLDEKERDQGVRESGKLYAEVVKGSELRDTTRFRVEIKEEETKNNVSRLSSA
ncbi:hypothetical protein CK203_042060 [Vitis vinifera]|uniref:DUF4283 domain-containing protein n=1 Tax=Vitis vinifera TaxID=29760 RepID=A0A438HHI6_VITVI|nr:hypothetical protein CK203_042060 [Vitis vinifera]